MKHLCIAVAATMVGAMCASAADKTWTGTYSDSMCGAKHNTVDEHGVKKMSDRDCTLACAKDHTANYLVVSPGRVYSVVNLDFAALLEHAGHTVRLTGEMSG